MSLVTISEARAQLNSSLTDIQLQAVIDREEAVVIRLFGAHYVDATATVTETLPGGLKNLYLRRKVVSITSATEDDELVASTGYRLWGNEGRVQRLPAGTSWGEVVAVVYKPVDDSHERKAAIIDLVRLALERTALKSENVAGEYSFSAPEWEAERAQVFRRIGFSTEVM